MEETSFSVERSLMSEQNNLLNSIRNSAGLRLAVLFCTFFVMLTISSLISMGIESIPFGNERDKGLSESLVQCILVFCLPAFLAARVSSDYPSRWLGFGKSPGILSLIGVIIVYLLSLPGMEWLIDWNAGIHFPQSMKNLEETFRTWEENNGAVSDMLLNADSIGGLLMGVLIIGVVTGFSEELFFRGGLQGIFQRSTLGNGLSVWIATFIFSCLHFQFFGFLPRLIMGAFFGYLFVWTGSLWVPVFAHALNNSVVVVTAYFINNPTSTNSDSVIPVIENAPYILPLVSLISTGIFLIFFRKFFFNKVGRIGFPIKKHRNIWQRKQFPPVSER